MAEVLRGAGNRRGVVVVGVDGSGRTHRLAQLAGPDAVWPPRFRDTADLVALVEKALEERAEIVVDDAHLRPPELLRRLAQAVEDGAVVLIARRPTVRLPELAALDGAVAATGAVEMLAPLPDETIATLLGDAPAATVAACAGSPTVAAALVGWSGADPMPAALTALVQRRVAVLSRPAAALVPVLAERLPLDAPVLARLAGVKTIAVAYALDELVEAGLLVPGADALVPAVAAAVRGAAAPGARRARGAAVAAAVVDAAGSPTTGGRSPDPSSAHEFAVRMRELGVQSGPAVALRLAAARGLAPTDAATAHDWAQEALTLLPDDADSAGVREDAALVEAEAAIVLGVPSERPGDEPVEGPHAERWAVLRGLRAAQDGRAARAVEELDRGGEVGAVLAAPLQFGTGLPVGPGSVAASTTAELLRRTAAAAVRPYDALPLVVEAAEALDRAPAAPLLPDTPHALGAVLAVLAGDPTTADHLLRRALTDAPTSAQRTRHVLLRAWIGLRTGRYAEAVRVTSEGGDAPGDLPGAREELLLTCVAAGLARRSGDIPALRAAWTAAEPLLVRRAADLWQLEQLEELAVAGARLRQEHRTEPVLAVLESALDAQGRPVAWEAAMAWLRLQCAVVRDDVDAADEATARLDRAVPLAPPPGRPPDGLDRARAQAAAARCWRRALRGEVDADAVVEASARLVSADLPWEGSWLAGQTAIRAVDPAVARQLLERARALGATAAERPATSSFVLSEREREVAELVRAGRTHREIGAQLYLSPKTVEHHVARMRSKLGAGTRAEFLAALARVLDGATGAATTVG